jgi:aminoglycoside phosphotransferase (APT) family kinase protein
VQDRLIGELDGERVDQRLSGIVTRLAGGTAEGTQVQIRPRAPLEHQSNRLYDAWANGRRLIVKEYVKPEEFASAPVFEYRALELLAPMDVAPRPVGFEPDAGPGHGPLVVYEYLDGEMWDRRRPSADELEALAEIWLRLHAIPAERVWESRTLSLSMVVRYAAFTARIEAYRDWTERAYPSGRDGAALCLDVLERRWPQVYELEDLGKLDPPRYFCRSDARFANVIARPDGRLGLVDWEDCGLRDPAREVGDLLHTANQEDLLGPEQWQAFLGPYLAALTPRDPHLVRRIELYRANYPIYWLSTMLREGMRRAASGELGSWRINGMSPNLRLRRYLARALAWPGGAIDERLAGLGGLSFFPNTRD